MRNEGVLNIGGSRSFVVRRKSDNERPPREEGLWTLLKRALPITRSRDVNIYRLKNLVNIWRGLWRIVLAKALGVPHIYGCLYGKIIRGDGSVVNLGLISMRVVTDTGVAFLVDAFQNTTELENLKFHGYGTGTNAEAAANTGLQTELTTEYATDNTRPTGSTTEGASANIYRTVATLSPDGAGTLAITEHMVNSQAATGGGTCWDRSVFSAINLTRSADSLQTTYDATFPSGG
jgi:hypothetical protein